MRRMILVTCGLAACTHELRPAAPAADIAIGLGYRKGFPIADGSELDVATRWESTCQESVLSHDLVPHVTSDLAECDQQAYAVRVECLNPSFPKVPLAEPCEITDDAGVQYNRVELPTVVGAKSFHIKLHSVNAQVVEVTMRHGDATYVHRTPMLRVVEPSEFVVECLHDNGKLPETWPATPCDAAPIARDEWLVVRAADDVPLGQIVVDGHRAQDSERLPIGHLVPHDAHGSPVPGDYQVAIDVNPAPHAVHRSVTLHVAPPP